MATRREKVILELQDDFTTGMAKAAAAAALLHRELEGLDGSGRRSSASLDKSSRSTRTLGKDVEDTGRKAGKAEAQIDKFSGRLRVLADITAILAPTIAPIGAVAIPAISGLAAEFGFAAVGAGTMIAAFQGVGDALKSVNKAALEPTEANLAAARLAMEQISPDAQRLVRELRDFEPALKGLRDTAAAGMFPGLVEGIDELKSRLPAVQLILHNVSETLGDIAADSGASLASGRWDDFFTFIATDAPPALASMSRAAGNVAHALAEMWMAFDPLNDDVISWLEKASGDFDEWASHLSESKGFHEFIDYVRETGPQVAATFAAIGNAVLQVVEASAPLGGPVLKAIEGVANALGAIANSKAGPTIMAAVTAMALLSRGQALFSSVSQRSWVTAVRGADTFSAKMTAARGPLLKGGAALAGLGLASSGAADKIGLSNTASLALIGTLGGPWGAAVGGAVGLALDLGSSHKQVAVDVESLTATLNQQTGAVTANTETWTANNLEKQGVLKAAAALGVSLSDVTDAALGNDDALSRVNAGLVEAKSGFYNADGTIKVGSERLREYGDNMHLVKDAIGGSNKALNDGQARIRRMADASGEAADGTGRLSAALQRSNAKMLQQQQAAATTAKAFITLGKDLDNAKVSLNGWIKQLAQQAAALEHFAANTRKAADKGLRQGLIAALQEAGPAGALRMKQLADGTQAQIAKANAAWARGQRAVRSFIATLGGVKSPPPLLVRVNGVEAAKVQINGLQAVINHLKGKTVVITQKTVKFGGGATGLTAQAEGGTIPGPRQPYGDKVLLWGAPGEEVITNRNGEADRFRADRAAGRIPMYANGGTIQRLASGGTMGSSSHIHALTLAIKKLTTSVDKERDARDDLISKRNDLASTTAGNFRSQLFGATPENFSFMNAAQKQAALTGSVFSTLKSDIANANAFKSALAGLKKRGLEGQAFADLAASGDLNRAQAFGQLSTAQLGSYETLFNQRAAATQSLGMFAGNAVFGAQITAQTRLIATQTNEIKGLRKDLKAASKKTKPIVVHDKSGKPHKTAKEVSRRQAMA